MQPAFTFMEQIIISTIYLCVVHCRRSTAGHFS